MAITRVSAWQSRLSEFVTANAQRPFRYGAFDCGLFVAGAIEAMSDVDVAVELRGSYGNRREAFKAIQRLCGCPAMDAIADYLAAQFDVPEISPAFAQRGDAVQLGRGRSSRLGIVALHGTELLTPYSKGLLRLSLSRATRAWRI